MGCQQGLKLGLNPVLLQTRIDAEIMLGVQVDFVDGDLQLLTGLVLDHPDAVGISRTHTRFNPGGARRTHPVQRLIRTTIGMNQNRTIALDHDHPIRRRQVGPQSTDIVDGAAGNNYPHGLGSGNSDFAARTVSTIFRMMTVAS